MSMSRVQVRTMDSERVRREGVKWARERSIVRAVVVNMADDEFDYDVLCERFSEPRDQLKYILRRHGIVYDKALGKFRHRDQR